MSNFYIGQEVVCVKSHQLGLVKKGQTYTIHSLTKGICACENLLVDVGMRMEAGGISGCKLHEVRAPDNGNYWFASKLFAPLQTKSEESDMEESIKEALENPLFV